MPKKKKIAFRCKCGYEAVSQKDLIDHCNEHHSDSPFMLYDMIGTAGSLKAADEIIKNLLIDKSKLESMERRYVEENNRLVKYTEQSNSTITKAVNTINIISMSTVLLHEYVGKQSDNINKDTEKLINYTKIVDETLSLFKESIKEIKD